jgi:hypothetical protein
MKKKADHRISTSHERHRGSVEGAGDRLDPIEQTQWRRLIMLRSAVARQLERKPVTRWQGGEPFDRLVELTRVEPGTFSSRAVN